MSWVERLCTIEGKSYALSLKKGCTKSNKHKDMFPINTNVTHNTRHKEKYLVPHTKTARYQNSLIVYMTHLLNSAEKGQ